MEMNLANTDQSVKEVLCSHPRDCGVPVFCDRITGMWCALFLCVPRWEAASLQKWLVPSRGFHVLECQRKELPALAGGRALSGDPAGPGTVPSAPNSMGCAPVPRVHRAL